MPGNGLFPGFDPVPDEVGEPLGETCARTGCGGELVKRLCVTGPHHARAMCSRCRSFHRYLPKPENAKRRPSSETCLAVTDYCEMCLRPREVLPRYETLEGHHVREVQDGGTKNNTPIWTLCTSCHDIVHVIRNIVQRVA